MSELTPEREAELRQRNTFVDTRVYAKYFGVSQLLAEVDRLRAELERSDNYTSFLKLEAALAARDAELARLREAVEMVRKRWTFSNDQQHTHNWHDMADCFEAIHKALLPPTPKEG